MVRALDAEGLDERKAGMRAPGRKTVPPLNTPVSWWKLLAFKREHARARRCDLLGPAGNRRTIAPHNRSSRNSLTPDSQRSSTKRV